MYSAGRLQQQHRRLPTAAAAQVARSALVLSCQLVWSQRDAHAVTYEAHYGRRDTLCRPHSTVSNAYQAQRYQLHLLQKERLSHFVDVPERLHGSMSS